jgi:hypothetical protein
MDPALLGRDAVRGEWNVHYPSYPEVAPVTANFPVPGSQMEAVGFPFFQTF